MSALLLPNKLYAQLEMAEEITAARMACWERYYENLYPLAQAVRAVSEASAAAAWAAVSEAVISAAAARAAVGNRSGAASAGEVRASYGCSLHVFNPKTD